MKINLTAPICSTGYGQSGYNIVRELSKTNDITLFVIGQAEKMDNNECILKTSFQANPRKIDIKAPHIRIWHQNELMDRVSSPHIGFPIFELETFSLAERESMNSCDFLFVTSEWAKNVVESNGIKVKTYVVPLGVDSEIFIPTEIGGWTSTKFFNAGKWEVRKGHDVLLECFNKAFDKKDNVELFMLCNNPFPYADGKKFEKLYSECKLSNKISILPRQATHRNVYYIMRLMDCGVFPARAEGWNLELLEMLSIGKQVITTNYSAHTEYCNKDNSMLIEIDKLEPAIDNVWFRGQGNWAHFGESQKEQLIEYMREVHRKKQDNTLKPNNNGITTGYNFSWSLTAHKINEALNDIQNIRGTIKSI